MGAAAIVAGVVSRRARVDVGYSGLASGLQDVLSLAFLVVILVFAVGVLLAGIRGRSRAPRQTNLSAPAT